MGDELTVLHLTVLQEDASHYGDVLESGISWAYETQYLEPYVEPGDVVVDVGANFGYTTTSFACEVGPDGYVISLEPEPDTRALLEHNVRPNGRAKADIVAAAAATERAPSPCSAARRTSPTTPSTATSSPTSATRSRSTSSPSTSSAPPG